MFKLKYYNPSGVPIFEGEVSNEILSSEKFILYNDGGDDNIYDDKIIGININQNYYNKKFRDIKVLLLSNGLPGKTCIIGRLVNNVFPNSNLATIGIDSKQKELN